MLHIVYMIPERAEISLSTELSDVYFVRSNLGEVNREFTGSFCHNNIRSGGKQLLRESRECGEIIDRGKGRLLRPGYHT